LDPARLTALFSDAAVLADLRALGAHLLLAFADLSPERAAIVQYLNAVGLPLVACLLESLRRALRAILWASAHPSRVLSGMVATVWLVSRWRRRAWQAVGPRRQHPIGL
jgi:hypothetical protein